MKEKVKGRAKCRRRGKRDARKRREVESRERKSTRENLQRQREWRKGEGKWRRKQKSAKI